MNNINDFINDVSHRPWEKPSDNWQYYQEWNHAVFLHFEVNFDDLRKLVPKKLELDHFNNQYYISIVIFKMENIRPRNLPSLDFISNFHEINVRTYIKNNDKTGVYFLNIEAEKYLAALVAKTLSGLPYEKSNIKQKENQYINQNPKKNFKLKIDYSIENKILNKTLFHLWITERYCLYLEKKHQFYRYEIHHKEWELYALDIKNISLNYKIGNLNLTEKNIVDFCYSPGVKVVSWKEEKLL